MPSPTVSLLEAERVSKILSDREGIEYQYQMSLCHLSRPSLMFQGKDGSQKILTESHVKQLLHDHLQE